MMKELHVQQMVKLENSYNQKITENEHIHSIKVEQLKNEFEKKILEISQSHQEAMSEKNYQIKQLETAVQRQCAKMEREVKFIRAHLQNTKIIGNEDYIEKIAFLEKCVAKMDRLFKRAEKEHKKQLAKLKKEIEIREKTNQVFFHTIFTHLFQMNFYWPAVPKSESN